MQRVHQQDQRRALTRDMLRSQQTSRGCSAKRAPRCRRRRQRRRRRRRGARSTRQLGGEEARRRGQRGPAQRRRWPSRQARSAQRGERGRRPAPTPSATARWLEPVCRPAAGRRARGGPRASASRRAGGAAASVQVASARKSHRLMATKNTASAATRAGASSGRAANEKPSSALPASPRKMRAGDQLKTRKPQRRRRPARRPAADASGSQRGEGDAQRR